MGSLARRNDANRSRESDPATGTASSRANREATVARALVQHLAHLGIEHSFGVSGGSIALFFDSLQESSIALHHFRHETGAAFAAAEAHFATGKPTLTFATSGPGLLNSITGLSAARWDGAKVVLVSGVTNGPLRGRWASQESSSYTLSQSFFYTRGPLFDFAAVLEHPSELPEITRRLSAGLSRPGGFVAHVAVPMSVQSRRVDVPAVPPATTISAPAAASADVTACACRLASRPFAIWVGHGAGGAARQVRRLAESTGARVFCSPRGKGIFPEDHPLFVGVTGLGGHTSVNEYMLRERPDWVLVLGSRLGEATSFWDRDLVPRRGFLHVDLDENVPGTAYPDDFTLGIQADVGRFLDALLEYFPASSARVPASPASDPRTRVAFPAPLHLAGRGPVRPRALMAAIQRQVIDGSDALVMSESGNAFAWCNHYLVFREPRRYRVSTHFGAMGHTACGVVGAALASGKKTVAVVGDGSMLMNSEISSAAQYRAPAVWIVLNDGGYGTCREGHHALGLSEDGFSIPEVEFATVARALGADGVRVETEGELADALDQALQAEGPFLVDVLIDPGQSSPLFERFDRLVGGDLPATAC